MLQEALVVAIFIIAILLVIKSFLFKKKPLPKKKGNASPCQECNRKCH